VLTYRWRQLCPRSTQYTHAATAPLDPHWMVYFTVHDVDRAVEMTADLGGALASGPVTTRHGRFAILEDPRGTMFRRLRTDHALTRAVCVRPRHTAVAVAGADQ
jgi:hypothetical protein